MEAELGQLKALQASLAVTGRPVSSGVFDSAVVLTTYSYTVGDSPRELRDTLRGAEAVSSWFEAWEARRSLGLALSPYELVHCGTYAIQSGTYPIPGAAPQDPVVRQHYLAQWVPVANGQMRLSRIWLSPDGRTRPAMWGPGCRSLSHLKAETRRFVLTVEGTFLRPRTIEETIRTAIRAQGYLGQDPIQPPTSASGAVGAMYRITPRYGVELAYEMVPPNSGEAGIAHPVARKAELWVNDSDFKILGVWQAGWIELAGGLAIAPVRLKWRDLLRPDSTAATVQVVPGVTGEVLVQVPGWWRAGPVLSVRFTRLRDLRVPAYADIPAFPIELRRSGASLGLRLWF